MTPGANRLLPIGEADPADFLPSLARVRDRPPSPLGLLQPVHRVAPDADEGRLPEPQLHQLADGFVSQSDLDVMKLFNDDPATEAVIMVGEIGGSDE